MNIIWFIVILTILLIFFVYNNPEKFLFTNETFTNESGKLCNSCDGKNMNQCTNCFNCGFCVDKWGNGACIAGDTDGPYNKEKCARWYSGDVFSRINWNNNHYKCEYGTKSANRVIGINPDYVNTCHKKIYNNICVNTN